MVATHNGLMSQVVCPRGLYLVPCYLRILYVNDITEGIQSTLEMFADDSKLYRIIQNLRDTHTATGFTLRTFLIGQNSGS